GFPEDLPILGSLLYYFVSPLQCFQCPLCLPLGAKQLFAFLSETAVQLSVSDLAVVCDCKVTTIFRIDQIFRELLANFQCFDVLACLPPPFLRKASAKFGIFPELTKFFRNYFSQFDANFCYTPDLQSHTLKTRIYELTRIYEKNRRFS
ncbi:MAG: hypothetical protein LIP09_05490, partial [Bacteroidales bacterium]|nr:hypothetical protein [Bacteroidales bacterium]